MIIECIVTDSDLRAACASTQQFAFVCTRRKVPLD